jgi:hypothetical protein
VALVVVVMVPLPKLLRQLLAQSILVVVVVAKAGEQMAKVLLVVRVELLFDTQQQEQSLSGLG